MIRIFRHYVPVQLLLLAVVEAAILIVSIYFAVALRFAGAGAVELLSEGAIIARALLFAGVMLISMTAFGLFTRESQTGDLSYYTRFLASFVVGGIAMTFIFYLFPGLLLGARRYGAGISVRFCGHGVEPHYFRARGRHEHAQAAVAGAG